MAAALAQAAALQGMTHEAGRAAWDGSRYAEIPSRQRLPARLCDALAADLGEMLHLRALGLAETSDAEDFVHAREHDPTIVTKDAD